MGDAPVADAGGVGVAGAPQRVQNLALGAISAPQLLHCIVSLLLD
jgi:hypothetical protein